jgi:hypothetical protein
VNVRGDSICGCLFDLIGSANQPTTASCTATSAANSASSESSAGRTAAAATATQSPAGRTATARTAASTSTAVDRFDSARPFHGEATSATTATAATSLTAMTLPQLGRPPAIGTADSTAARTTTSADRFDTTRPFHGVSATVAGRTTTTGTATARLWITAAPEDLSAAHRDAVADWHLWSGMAITLTANEVGQHQPTQH